MSRFFYSKSIDFLFVCVVMFCAILVIIPINNVSYISDNLTWGTLLFRPTLDFLSLAHYAFNALMFVPIAFFAYFWFNKLFAQSFSKGYALAFAALLFCIILSTLFELAQLLLHYRVTDFDDVIMNTMGALVGILLAQALCALAKRPFDILTL